MLKLLVPTVAALCLASSALAANADYVTVKMEVESGFLSPEERQVVNLLIKAADQMSVIYALQSKGSGPGKGFYPEGMTKEAFEAYLVAHSDEKATLTNGYTVVRRAGERLVAVPYSEVYKAELERAAELLEQAAAVTTNASLKRFLSLRAASFRSNDYFQSELAWMDLEGTPIEVAIGPYETYTDELRGAKTAFEAFVTLKKPAESRALDKYKDYLRAMEANLPVEERFKNFARGAASPIAVAEQVRGGGDNVGGPQATAFNLPNDERVREAKGAKKVILSNVLGAKYERILAPIAGRALVPGQASLVNRKYMTLETLFHELSHSLGPGSITVDGRATTVYAELKDIHGTAEEAKADVMGVYNVLFMMQKGELPAAERPQVMATYMAGVIRAVRWGDGDSHGRGAALQYGYLKAKGGFTWDAKARRFQVDDARMAAGIRELLAEIVTLQAKGDYPGMNALFDRYAKLDADAQSVIATLKDIPVDISPVYPDEL